MDASKVWIGAVFQASILRLVSYFLLWGVISSLIITYPKEEMGIALQIVSALENTFQQPSPFMLLHNFASPRKLLASLIQVLLEMHFY